MWWVRTKSTGEEEGGFQNRDVGKTSFDKNYGPDFGVDYARFSDPPDILKDLKIKELLSQKIKVFDESLCEFELKVRNGFVLLQGYVKDHEVRESLLEVVYATEGVKEIINNLQVFSERREKDISH